jgi:hypothetical protein
VIIRRLLDPVRVARGTPGFGRDVGFLLSRAVPDASADGRRQARCSRRTTKRSADQVASTAQTLLSTIPRDKPYSRTTVSKVVYKIIYPNGKIYVGLDLTGTALYFGTPSMKDQIADELGPDVCRDFSIRKQIIWESTDASDAEARAAEVRLIRAHGANDPSRGYNRWPRF